MMRRQKIVRFVLILLTASYTASLAAQAFVSIKPSVDTVGLGDTFSLKVTLSLDKDAKASIPDFSSIFANSSSLFVVESLGRDTIQGELGYYVYFNLRLQCLDTGRISLPMLSVPYKQNGKDTFCMGDSLWIFSTLRSSWNPEEPAPPADIIRLAESGTWLWWLLAGVLLILAVLALIYFLKKRKPRFLPPSEISTATPIVCPEHKALQQLEEIQKHLGDSAAFFGGLNELMRNYLQLRFNLNTQDKTPEELAGLFQRDILIRNRSIIYEMLHGAEYVLYGKGQTLEEYQHELLEKARHFLEQMKQQWGDCS
jgi:hypothetical protein